MNITSKGRVTIPLRLRNRFGLKPGTVVVFVVEENKVVIRPKRRSNSSLDSWLEEATGFLRGPSTDERMRLTRDVARYRTYFPKVKLITPED